MVRQVPFFVLGGLECGLVFGFWGMDGPEPRDDQHHFGEIERSL